MRTNRIIPGIAVIGIITLFFFPEPQTNFIYYLGTALFFIFLIVFLIILDKRKNKNYNKGS